MATWLETRMQSGARGQMSERLGTSATYKPAGTGSGESLTVVWEEERTERTRNDTGTHSVRRRMCHADVTATDAIGTPEAEKSTLTADGVTYTVMTKSEVGGVYMLDCESGTRKTAGRDPMEAYG